MGEHPKNVAGDFYVEHECCALCGVPCAIAPTLFDHDKSGCWVSRQAVGPDDEADLLEVGRRPAGKACPRPAPPMGSASRDRGGDGRRHASCELAEFAADRTQGTSIQRGPLDTWSDVALGCLGAAVALAVDTRRRPS